MFPLKLYTKHILQVHFYGYKTHLAVFTSSVRRALTTQIKFLTSHIKLFFLIFMTPLFIKLVVSFFYC